MEMEYGFMTGSVKTVKTPAAGLRGSGTLVPAGGKWKGHIAARNTGRPLTGWSSRMALPDGMRTWPGTGSRGLVKTRGPGERSGAFGSPLVPAKRRSSLGRQRGHAPERNGLYNDHRD